MNYKVSLDVFEGPLDLLLYLIKKEELNIYDIPMARITEQYLEYVELMELMDLEIAGEFLVMAATLMHIKSRTLLPPEAIVEEEDETDPRAELVRQLLEYKRFKEAAQGLKEFELKRSLLFSRFGIEADFENTGNPFERVSLFELIAAFSKVLKELQPAMVHEVVKDEFTVGDKVQEITFRLKQTHKIYFSQLFSAAKNRYEVITTFLALLELIRLKTVSVDQPEEFGEIEIRKGE